MMVKVLQEMTWEDVTEALAKTGLAIIPTGSVEQHGPALPVGTDYIIADHIARRVGEKSGAVVTPVIPVGFASYHGDFAGTLSVDTETLTRYYQGIADCLIWHGFSHILFVNGHGGNGAALTAVCRNLRDRGIAGAYVQWFDIAGLLDPRWSLIGHADIVEVSMMLHIAPRGVKMDKAAIPTNKKLTNELQILDGSAVRYGKGLVRFGLRTSDTSDTGDLIEYGHSTTADYSVSPAAATAENGRQIIDAVTDYIVSFLKEFTKVRFKPVRSPRDDE